MVNVSLNPRGGEGRIRVTALPVTLERTVQLKSMNVILIPVSEVSDYFFMPNRWTIVTNDIRSLKHGHVLIWV